MPEDKDPEQAEIRGFASVDALLQEIAPLRDSFSRHAYVLLSDWSLAQDCVQDTFCEAGRHWARLQSGPPLIGWLRRVLHSKAMDILNERRRKIAFSGAISQLLVDHYEAHSPPSREDIEQQDHRQSLLQQCMLVLSDDSRDILRAFYILRKPVRQLAELRKRSENAIMLTLSKSRKLLRECVSLKTGKPS